MEFPRVLVVTLGRINATDNKNNGLLLRNLFEDWPIEKTAQIFSSGENDDQGYFGRYYKLGPDDRFMGQLFYELKRRELETSRKNEGSPESRYDSKSVSQKMKFTARKLFFETGLYELLFRPRLSVHLKEWTTCFQPDLIFAQGYNYTFSIFPLMLSAYFDVPIIYYTTDDWPNQMQRLKHSMLSPVSRFCRKRVSNTARKLIRKSSVRIAFNQYMREEYLRRYGKNFHILMHGDDMLRFEKCEPIRIADENECSIVCIGVFGESRLPLIDDLDIACDLLNLRGIKAKATVFPVNSLSEENKARNWRHIAMRNCPTHHELPCLLKGADILFLPERFDDSVEGIRLSISSKAPLFMFSENPIVVYSDSASGIAKYAKDDGWAFLVDTKDPSKLADAFENLYKNSETRERLLESAKRTAIANHDIRCIKKSFLDLVKKAAL